MENSILAHLGGRLAGQQELLATEGLAYVLARSEACADVIRRLARGGGCELPEGLRFRVEVAGEDLERPDIVGSDGQNAEVVILEGKFDAGLTDNQPNAYLRRLGRSRPGLLMFVVPELRVPRLWREVTRPAGATDPVVPDDARGRDAAARFYALDPARTLAMISWRALLDLMLHAAGSASDPAAADVRQLQSLCARFEGDAFLPFGGEELSGLRLPRRHRDLCDIVDAIVDALAGLGEISLTGFRATPLRSGYIRYMRLGGASNPVCAASLGLMYEVWRAFEASPIWLEPVGSEAAMQGPIVEAVALRIGAPVAHQNGRTMLALPVEPNLERQEIIVAGVTAVREVIAALRSAGAHPPPA